MHQTETACAYEFFDGEVALHQRARLPRNSEAAGTAGNIPDRIGGHAGSRGVFFGGMGFGMVRGLPRRGRFRRSFGLLG